MSEVTNIKVLEQEVAPVYIERLSSAERKLFYEVNRISEDEVGAIEDWVNMLYNLEMPGLDELVLKKIISISKIVQDMYDYPLRRSYNFVAAPIIPNIYNLSIRGGASGGASGGARGGASGGARGGAGEYYGKRKKLAEMMPRQVNTSRAAGALIIKFDEPTRCITEQGKEYIAAIGEDVAAIGISIDFGVLRGGGDDEFQKANERMLIKGNYLQHQLGASHLSSVSRFNPIAPSTIIFSTIGNPSDAIAAIYESVRDFYTYMLSSDAFVANELQTALKGAATPMGDIISKIKQHEIEMPRATPMVLPEPLKQLLTELGAIMKQEFLGLPEVVTYSSLDRVGLIQAFNSALLYGKDDPKARTHVGRVRLSRLRADMFEKLAANYAADLSVISAYRSIVRDKLGLKRANEIDARLRTGIISSEKFLSYLADKERDLVLAEYRRRNEYVEASINNKCEHRRDVQQMNKALLEEDRAAAFIKVMKWAAAEKKGAAKDMIKCQTCDYDLICPHVVDLNRLQARGAEFGDIKAAMQKYISSDVHNYTYYCNICGVEIASREDYGNVDREVAAFMDEEIKIAITQEVFTALKALRFKTVVHVGKLMGAIRDATYPFIFEVDKRLSRSKTNTASVIAARKKLNIAIYVYAYLTFIVVSNDNINFATMKERPKGLGDYLKQAFVLINASKNAVIRAIPGYSPELLKTQLIEAYKEVTRSAAPTIMDTSEQQALLMSLMQDPVLDYLYWLNVIYSGMKGGLVKNINEVLGTTIMQLSEVKTTSIFKTAKIPPKAFTEDGDSLRMVMKYINEGIYLENVYVDTTALGPSQAKGLRSEFSTPYMKFYEELRAIAPKDEAKWQAKRFAGVKPYDQWPAANTIQFIASDKSTLGRVYDHEGNPHKWTKWICDDGKEYTTAELGALGLDAPRVVDKLCGVCSVKFSEAGEKIDDKRVRETLSNKQSIINFYKFYENRCLKGGSHEFGTAAVCSKCSITRDMPAAQSAAFAFYKKNRAQYRADKAEINKVEQAPAAAIELPDHDKVAPAKWAYDFSKAMKVAALTGINSNIINCIGAMEKIDYEDIKAGKFIPTPTDEHYNTRAYKIFAHIRHVIIKYNNLRFYSSITKPPPELVELLDASGVPRHRYRELETMLGAITMPTRATFEYFKLRRKASELVNYSLELLCDVLLFIADKKAHDPVTATLRESFVKWVLADIITSEEMRTKHGRINWNIIYGERGGDDAAGSDAAGESAEVDIGEEDVEAGIEVEDEEGGAFTGLADMDLDSDVSEREGDDDGGNVVRITGID